MRLSSPQRTLTSCWWGRGCRGEERKHCSPCCSLSLTLLPSISTSISLTPPRLWSLCHRPGNLGSPSLISTSRRSLFLCLLLPASLYRPVDAKLVERNIFVEEKLAAPDRRRNQVAAGGGHHVDDDEGALQICSTLVTNLLLRDSGQIKDKLGWMMRRYEVAKYGDI